MEFSRSMRLLKKDDLCKQYAYRIVSRFQWSTADGDELKGENGNHKMKGNFTSYEPGKKKSCSADDDSSSNKEKWKPEIAWIGKALEPVLQLYKWALRTGTGNQNKPPPTDISFTEILSCIQRSKLGVQDWSLTDLTVGMYLVYLQQASMRTVEDVKGELVTSESIVRDLIYHTELAKGTYKENATSLARHSMLREKNVVKFVKVSSVLRPGYYIGIDMREKLVVVGIRGTHTIRDVVTDIITSGHEEITFEGYSTHFGAAEAARWFLSHEINTIRKCLEKHKGFRLRLVGHSLGGATASLLAIMLRRKSFKDLGFSPDIVTAVGFATPPCVSKELSESCSDFVSTVVMQDDIIPRLSIAVLTRLRNEIVETDWMSVISKEEDWKGIVDMVNNAKQIMSSVHDIARKLTDYAKFSGQAKISDASVMKEDSAATSSQTSDPPSTSSDHVEPEKPAKAADDLFVPGTVYYLKRNVDAESPKHKRNEYFTLLKRHRGEHFERILISGNLILNHKCDSHYYALRDVLKGLPSSVDDRTTDE